MGSRDVQILQGQGTEQFQVQWSRTMKIKQHKVFVLCRDYIIWIIRCELGYHLRFILCVR